MHIRLIEDCVLAVGVTVSVNSLSLCLTLRWDRLLAHMTLNYISSYENCQLCIFCVQVSHK